MDERVTVWGLLCLAFTHTFKGTKQEGLVGQDEGMEGITWSPTWRKEECKRLQQCLAETNEIIDVKRRRIEELRTSIRWKCLHRPTWRTRLIANTLYLAAIFVVLVVGSYFAAKSIKWLYQQMVLRRMRPGTIPF
eukprot:comp18512_c0_seq1/m.19911 comp18512_c0_seq1/g.19911  ORF comp18512_c0_seq1/g.19911 comp18512_c0_seq1/m.19911 type:complete len:135 (-) comp18512_c0_seq1:357-761(-)